MRGAVFFRGTWLCRGSVALELHEKGEWLKLDIHLKDVEKKWRTLHGIEGTKQGEKR
jgi:hypothetical protein